MRLLTFLMQKEAEEAGERALDTFKQRVFATAFSSFEPKHTLERYYKLFDEPEPEEQQYEYEVTEFEPETEEDVLEMVNAARRAGVIT